MPPSIDIMRTVFPVVALQQDDSSQAARPDSFGTAFCVAPGVFMTAGHVVLNAQAAGRLAIAGPAGEGRALGAALAQDVEVWEARDVALVRCDVNGVTPLNTWLTHRVQVLTDLSSFGYPHAITWSPSGEQLNVLFRAYKGHVITTRGFDRLPGPPAVYEMSCAFPVGMSGAPLLIADDEVLAVAGVVLGVDIVKYGGVEQSVGIALMAEDIVHLESKLAGGPIASSLGFASAAFQIHSGD